MNSRESEAWDGYVASGNGHACFWIFDEQGCIIAAVGWDGSYVLIFDGTRGAWPEVPDASG